MSRRRKQLMQFRYYDIPQKEHVLAMLGEDWIRSYGEGIGYLHFHNLCEVGICRDGFGILTLDEQNYPYEPGMISVIPRNYPHTTNSEEGTKSFWEYLFLDPEQIIRAIYPENEIIQKNMLDLVNKTAIFGKSEQYPFLTGIADEIMDEMRQKGDFYTEAIQGLLSAFVFETARANKEGKDVAYSSTPGRITPIAHSLTYVNEHFGEEIKVDTLAEECSMSETHFRRVFSEQMNMTPVEYINMVRIQRACEYMKKSDESMNSIAFRCGFITPSTFNRNFKKLIGVSPYQWKRSPGNYESKLIKFHISAEKGW